MDLIAIIAAIEKFAPVILEIADALKLNKIAADLVRKLGATLVDDAKKTATPIDDALAWFISAALGHVADLLEQGAVKEALSLLNALSKLTASKPAT